MRELVLADHFRETALVSRRFIEEEPEVAILALRRFKHRCWLLIADASRSRRCHDFECPKADMRNQQGEDDQGNSCRQTQSTRSRSQQRSIDIQELRKRQTIEDQREQSVIVELGRPAQSEHNVHREAHT